MNTIRDLHDEKDSREYETNFQPRTPHRKQQAPTHLERRFLKVLHWMHCPKCGYELTAERFDSVEIDICPNCRGIWLDLEQIRAITSSDHGPLRSFLRLLGPLKAPTKSNEG
jgi:hypothetical protein